MQPRLTVHTLAFLLLSTPLLAGCEATSPVEPQEAPAHGVVGDLIGDVGILTRLVLLEVTTAIGEDSTAAIVGPEGGTIRIPGGHRIDFPEGAVAEDTRISAKIGHSDVLKVTFAPHGLEFPSDRRPTLTMSYGLLDQLLLTPPAIVYVDDADRILEYWPGSWNILNRTASAKIGHFSSYALASN